MRTYSWSQVFHQFYKPTSSFALQDSGNKIFDIIHICRVAGSSTVTVTATYPRMNYCTLYVTAARSWAEKRQRNSSVCLTKTMTASCLGKNLWNSLNATEKLQKVTWPSRKNLSKKNHSSFRVVRFKVLYHNSHSLSHNTCDHAGQLRKKGSSSDCFEITDIYFRMTPQVSSWPMVKFQIISSFNTVIIYVTDLMHELKFLQFLSGFKTISHRKDFSFQGSFFICT